MVFDAGITKTCRHNQFFGVRAAQDHVQRRQGGIIWHTQGSGKSLTMVWLAKWIRENVQDARVLVITDRTELDEQIEKVFKGVDEQIHRTRSGADLIDVLNRSDEWLIASLIHKFGASEEGDVEAFIQDMRSHLPKGFRAKGNLFVFVDECHRTQSGKLHEAMKTILPEATLIGFTGTPLLKKDKRTSIEIFGPYIHTYRYDEAVHDGVVLDLRYEARDIDQHITSQEKIDQWFELKTRGLNDYARAQLKKRWGTLQKVLSSRDRLEKIVSDILWDMATRDRLMSGHGNAMLVAGSIYSACRLYEMFQATELKGKCAIVTSYVPATAGIKGEATGEGETEKLHQYEIYRRMLAEHFDAPEETALKKVETFEKEVKKRFIKEPGRMKLLIVVDKLLTGFDAPPATYLYIDKQMRDHGLFQAICRVNRLHTEDKEVGYIVDYKDLFKSLEQSIKDYTGGAFDAYDAEDVEGLLEDRLDKARERLEETREAVKALCEPVEPPRDSPAYRRYFVGPSDAPRVQKDNEPRRVAAPLHLDDEAVRLAIVDRLPWIRRQQQDFARQSRQGEREMVSGESHYFQGVRYRLNVVPHDGRPSVRITNGHTLQMTVPPGMDAAARRAMLDRWYRRQLRDQVPALLNAWEPTVGVKVAECRIRKMKTRWGSCSPEARRIWLNLELMKKPPACLEYVLVHEMVHFLEHHHNARFKQLLDRFMPQWRLHRDALNSAPLAHEDWTY